MHLESRNREPQHTIHKGTEWLNASTVHSYKCYEHMSQKRLTGNAFLPLVLYACRTAVHSSTGFAPFELMFGHTPQKPVVHPHTALDPSSYHGQLQAKLAQLRDFVETYIAESAHHQKTSFDRHAQTRTFQVGDSVWLSIPTAGKLDPRWERKWVVHSIPGPTSYIITDGKRLRTVHVNRLQQRIQPDAMIHSQTWWQIKSSQNRRLSNHTLMPRHNPLGEVDTPVEYANSQNGCDFKLRMSLFWEERV